MFKNEKGGGDLLITVKKSNIITISMILLSLAVIFAIGIDDVAADSSMLYVNGSSGNDSWDGQLAVWNGTSGPKATIKNATGTVLSGGTMNIASGTYNENDITINKNLYIIGENRDTTIINGTNSNRIFTIGNGFTVTISNLTLTNGQVTGNGGAIYNNNAGTTVNLNNCKFTSNTISRTTGNTDIYGGAVYSRGPLNIINCNFTSNTAVSGSNNEGYGGAIYCTGTLTITGSNFTGNSVNSVIGTRTDDGGAVYSTGVSNIIDCNFTGNSARNGGAVYQTTAGSLTVNNSTFTSNTAVNGGAIYNTRTLTVTNSSFTSNSATTAGGAIWSGSSVGGTTLTITGSNFGGPNAGNGNTAVNGGAIYNNAGNSNISGSNFERNTATTNGGAIFNNGGTAEIHFNRIIGNTPVNSEIRRGSGTVNAQNNWWGSNENPASKVSNGPNVTTWLILTVTASPTSIPVSGTSTVTASLTRNSNNVDTSSLGHVPDGISVDFTSTLGSIYPVSAATLNGIATATFTGSNSGIATVNATVDSVNVGTTIRVGTDIYVSDTRGNDDTGDGSQANPYKTIAKGISMVSPGGTVYIENGTYSGTGNVGITVNSNITITGEGRDSTIIDGQNANRMFIIPSGYTVTISNMTLRNGLASNSNGGAIQNNGGTLTINNCAFTSNRATGTGTNYGGAIYNTGTLAITGSTFTSNTADNQGGAIHTDGSLTITGSTFTGNSASDGGAIYSNSNLSIANSSFTSNAAAMNNNGAGGAICIGDSSILGMSLTITDSTFTGNRGQHGGVLWTNAGSSTNPATITNSTFTDNTGTYGGVIRNWGILNIIKSSFIDNSGTEGGAINNYNGGRSILTVTESNLINNTATNGGAVYNAAGTAEIHFNRIIGNTGTDLYRAAGTLNGQNNWWGNNYQGSSPLTAGRVNSGVNAVTWLVLNITASPNLIHVDETSTVTADLTHDNNGADTSSQGHIPDGILINFASILGTINQGTTVNGRVTATFNAGSKPGIATVSATVDSQTVNTQITIGRDDVYVSPTGNDETGDGNLSNPLRTIAAGIAGVYPGGTVHIASGTYNEHDLNINKDLTIVGTSAASTIINAEQLGRIFDITSGTVTIQNITLANGTVTGNGGAINNAGTLTITGSELLNNTASGDGSAIYNTGTVGMHFNRILGTGNVIASPSGSVDATLNWWVSNDSPSSKVSGNVDVSIWLVLRVTASPNAIKTGETAVVTADITHDNTGVYHDPALGHVPDGIQINFSSSLGTVSPGSAALVNGIATTTFTATSYSGVAVVNATGSPTVSTEIDILGDNVYVSPTGNDETGDGSAGNPYATIAKGVQMTAPNGTLHIGSGTYTGTLNRDITVDKNINIVGSGANSAVIDAQGQGRIFDIMNGANVVIQNITLSNGSVTGNGGAINNAGTLTITGTNLQNNTATGTGSAIYNTGTVTINFNRIIGTGNIIASPNGHVNAVNNWWGSNSSPSGKVSGNVNVNTWLVLNITTNPNSIYTGGKSTITADLLYDNLGSYHDPAYGHVPDGIPVTFGTDLGIIDPTSVNLTNGQAQAILNCRNVLTPCTATVSATIDSATLTTTVNITVGPVKNIDTGKTYASIGEAVNDPDTLNGHTITVSNGTYTGANNRNITIDKNLTIIGENKANTIVNAEGNGRIFIVNGGITFTIHNLTFANGTSTEGGAIYNNGNLTVENCTFTNNTAIYGGAIHNDNILTVSNSTFTSNGSSYTYSYAGAIYNDNSLTIENCTFTGNNANENGGVIVNWGTLNIKSSTFTDNTASRYGGAIHNGGALTISDSTFTGNSAIYGGAISNYSNLTVTGSTFTNNSAQEGGAIRNVGGNASNRNVHFNRFVGNSPSSGEIYSEYGTLNALNNWWGSNDNPISKVSGNVDVSKWIVLTVNASTTQIPVGGTSSITADLLHDNTGAYHNPANGHVPDGINVTFGCDYLGLMTPITSTTVNGITSSIFTGRCPGTSIINVTVDNQTNALNVTIGTVSMYVRNYNYNSLYTGWDYHNTPVFVADITNNGPNDATGVIVDYVLSNGFEYLGCDTLGAGTATFNPLTNTITWNIGYMPNGGQVYMVVYTRITSTGSITLTARLNSVDQFNSDTTHQQRARTLTVLPDADIQVNQTVNNSNPHVGENITYTITVKNNGPNNATGVVINDLLPSGLTITDISLTKGVYDPVSGNWTIGNLNNGETVTLNITTQVTQSGTIITRAVRPGNNLNWNQHDWNLNNNSQEVIINIGTYTPNVSMYVRNYNYNSLYTGWDYHNTPVFVADITNNGPNDATGVIVDYVLGNGFEYLGCDTLGAGTATFNPLTNTITWNIGYMPNGGQVYMVVYTRITSTGSITLTARLNHVDQNNTDTTHQQRARTLTVLPDADIQVNQTVDNTNPHVGENITYTITVKNNGPNNATGVVINNLLPSGLTITDISLTKGVYDPVSGNWTIGNLNNGETVTLNITTQVTQSGTIITRAVRPGNNLNWNQHDWNLNNNSQMVYVAAIPAADIQVNQTVDNETPTQGQNITYTITVTNNGPSNATGVTITDQLPDGLVFVSADTHGVGSYNSSNGLWTIGNLGNGDSAILTITVQTTITGAINNTASKTSETEYDPIIANDQTTKTITIS